MKQSNYKRIEKSIKEIVAHQRHENSFFDDTSNIDVHSKEQGNRQGSPTTYGYVPDWCIET